MDGQLVAKYGAKLTFYHRLTRMKEGWKYSIIH